MLPTAGQVAEIPCLVPRSRIPREFEDANGHVNIRHYLDLGSTAVTACLERVGVNDAYRAGGLGLFTAENHLAYFAELLVGQEVSVHAHMIGRTDKAIHCMAYVLNDTLGVLAATFESLTVHIEFSTRRSCVMPQDLADRVDTVIRRGRTSWAPPAGRAVALRGEISG